MMNLRLSLEERIVLKFLQSEEDPLPATTVADRTGLENNEVMDAFSSLAEKELFIAEDRTAGELSPLGWKYNLFGDESIDELYEKVRAETKNVLYYFLDDPDATPSSREIEVTYGLTPEQIERAIEELETWGYPARSRINR
jgi:hypothetical protein